MPFSMRKALRVVYSPRAGIWFLISLLLASPVRPQDERTAFFDVLHYDIAVTLGSEENSIAGQTEVVMRCRKPFRRIRLDFDGMNVTLVSRDDRPLDFRRLDGQLEIVLPERTVADEVLRVKIAYNGQPRDGLILKKNKYGRFTAFADNWPNRAHYWFPCVDHPSDKATMKIQVTAPAEMRVVANGRFVRRRELLNGAATTTFDEAVPIPTYCMVFGAARFDTYFPAADSKVPLSFWVFPEDFADARHDFARAGRMVEYYALRFGDFPYEKLALVQSSTRFGGMENAGAIFFAEASLGTPRNIEGTVAHEIAHQWFGDAVTPLEWNHLWLSEGFATYLGMQFFEYADGKDAFRQRLRESRRRYLAERQWRERAIVEPVPENLMELLNPNNYTRGGWVLHMLRKLVGDAVFWRGVRKYFDLHRNGNAVTEDFRAVMEAEYGRPLDWFFQQWVYQGGVPELHVTYHWDADSRNLLLRIQQRQPSPPKRIPLHVRIHADRTIDKTIWSAERDAVVPLYFSEKPENIEIDPDVELLAEIELEETYVPPPKRTDSGSRRR